MTPLYVCIPVGVHDDVSISVAAYSGNYPSLGLTVLPGNRETALFLSSSSLDPPTTATFEQAIAGSSKIDNFYFGAAPNSVSTITSLADLSRGFNPYGIAGTSEINQEWARYQPFNSKNFVFTNFSLNIEATLPATGGVFLDPKSGRDAEAGSSL